MAKIIPRNYGKIGHLPGSRMIDNTDTFTDPTVVKRMTENLYYGLNSSKFRPGSLLLEVQEKVDGSNVGVIKLEGVPTGLNKKGYGKGDFKLGFQLLLNDYIEEYKNEFNDILSNGERVVGEWMVCTHSLKYNLPHTPLVVYDIHDASNKKISRIELDDRLNGSPFARPTRLYLGTEALSIPAAMELLGTHGHHGCIGNAEGVMYRLYRDNMLMEMVKYVNPNFNNVATGAADFSPNMWNDDRFKFEEYGCHHLGFID